MKVLLCLLLVVCGALAAPKKDLKIPSYVKTCPRNLPNFNDCLKDSLQDIFPRLAGGIKEMDLPPIDPMAIEEILMDVQNGIYKGKSIVKDVYTYGISTAQFNYVKTNFEDPNNIKLELNYKIPVGRAEGLFKQQGKILGTDFSGRGNFNITGYDMNVTLDISGALEERNGNRYLNVKQFYVTPDSQELKFDASNLFNGNQVMSQAFVGAVNQYWKVMYAEMLPIMQEAWDKPMRKVVNRFFQRVPFDNIFPLA